MRIQITRSIAYAEGSRRTLDLYRPVAAVAAPVVVFFYGGAWQSGSKWMYGFVARALARRGYVAVVPDYRVFPQALYPDFLEDGALAVRWVKDNAARFGGAPEKLFVMGHSAGAHIAAMLTTDGSWLGNVGLVPNRDISGLIGISGPYDFLPLQNTTLKVIFGGDNEAATQPIFHVSAGAPPALLLTGGRDGVVQPGNAARFAARLVAAGNDATVLVYSGIGHYLIVAAFTRPLRRFIQVLRDVDAFMVKIAGAPTMQ